MLTSNEEASLRESLRFREEDRWLHLLYRSVFLLGLTLTLTGVALDCHANLRHFCNTTQSYADIPGTSPADCLCVCAPASG